MQYCKARAEAWEREEHWKRRGLFLEPTTEAMTKHAPLQRGEVTTKLKTTADKGDETKWLSLPFSKEENAPMKTQKPAEEHSSRPNKPGHSKFYLYASLQ